MMLDCTEASRLTNAIRVLFCFAGASKVTGFLNLPLGSNEVKRYYDAKTGVCVRQSQVAETPQGEQVINVDFSDYRTVDGVMLPHVMIVPLQPGMNLEVKTTLVVVNGEVDMNIFN